MSEELAYIAGLFDGEGCVNFTRAGKQRTWVIRAMLRNTDRKIIEFLQERFGGRIETAQNSKYPHWKPSFCWRLDWDAAIAFLIDIEPWVRIKRDQILVAKFWDVLRARKGERHDAEYHETIELLVKQLQWLNRKGPRGRHDIEPMKAMLSTIPSAYFEDGQHALN